MTDQARSADAPDRQALLSLPDLLLAIDQGTTSSRAIVFSGQGEIAAVAQRELALTYPHDGWVEQDAEQIWQDTLAVCLEVLEQVNAAGGHIAATGITNQRETTVVWDRKTGKPVYNAIVWQDRRTAGQCEALKHEIDEQALQRSTGLLLDPYFSATKIRWILDNVDGAAKRAANGELLFGTIECFLLWKLTNGKAHMTDASNASRTLLYDINRQDWSPIWLERFGIPERLLPQVADNTANFGVSDANLLGREIPITAMIGDQQSALAGQGCFQPGSFKATYGTGCFMLMNTGDQPVFSTQRLLTTTAYRINGATNYAIEGSVFVAGAAVQWLRDGLKIISSAAESEAMATELTGNDGVYFVPALTGLGAPYWNADARGSIVGLSRDTGASHIVRAALEAQAYQTRDIVDAFLRDQSAISQLASLRVDGGLVANQFVCQMLADILQTPVEVPQITEATAWGAASLAGLQVGLFDSLQEIADCWKLERHYDVQMPKGQADTLYAGWQRAVSTLL